MKLLYITDHKFFEHGDEVRSPGQFPGHFWDRFLHSFDSVEVLARKSRNFSPDPFNALNRADREGVDFYFLPEKGASGLYGKLFFQGESLLGSALERADAVVIRNSFMTGPLVSLCRKYNKPYALEVSGNYFRAFWYHGSLSGKVLAPFMEWQSRHCIRNAPYALYVTQQELQAQYPTNGKSVGISNVALPDNPEWQASTFNIRQESTLQEPFTIGFCGSLSNRQKGVHNAIKALAWCKDDLPPFKFHVIGAGDTTPWQELADKYGLSGFIVFDGFMPGGQPVLNWMSKLDLFLYPSLQDGLPRSLIEAMYCGCPALSSNIGGISELLPDEALHQPGDITTLSRQITEVINSMETRQKWAERNHAKASEFRTSRLEPRREHFWAEFKAFAEGYAFAPSGKEQAIG